MKALIPWRKKDAVLPSSRQKDDAVQVLQHRVNDLFEEFFGNFDDMFTGGPLARRGENWLAESPSFEVSETDDEFRVKAELPGMETEDIDVNMEGNELIIRGEKKREHEEKRRNYHISEMSYGEFFRSFQLPEGVDREKAKAQFKKGVLTLTLPKTEQVKAQRKRIDVRSE